MASDRMVASIIDPQCGTVYLYQDSQNSQPSEAFHGIGSARLLRLIASIRRAIEWADEEE